MDVLEEALELFMYCLDFYQEWRIAQRKLKRELEKEKELEIEGEFASVERELFAHTLQRHVEIAKKFMLDLYGDFDLYVIDKNRNPFVTIRPGKKNKKIRFGSKRYPVEVDVEPDEVFTLFDRMAEEAFTKKELELLNKVYKGTINICRLQDFMNDVRDDPPAERGEEVVVEMVANDGQVVRGVLTYSPYATLGKELDDHLEAINTCKNLSFIEMHFINEIEFGLKIIVAKLKRMKSPYITAIQNAVKISEVPVTVSATEGVADDVTLQEEEKEWPEITWDVPPEGHKIAEEVAGVAGAVHEHGGGDSGGQRIPSVRPHQHFKQNEAFEMQDYPFAEHPDFDESEDDKPAPPKKTFGNPRVEIPPIPNFPSRSNCCIQ